MNIEMVEKADHLSLLDIWEASVRATHDFLAEEDLQELKPLILEQYFDAVHLKCAKNDNGEILGFCQGLIILDHFSHVIFKNKEIKKDLIDLASVIK